MPVSLPIAASSGRELSDKPRQIPKSVQLACLDMIHQGIDFVAAARANGLKPDTMRRHLHRAETIAFLRRERVAFRLAICAGNEFHLAEIRNTAENTMARVAAVRALEGLGEEDRAGPASPSAGVVIRIVSQSAPRPIDVTPSRGVIEHDPQR